MGRFYLRPSTTDLPQPKPNTKHGTLSAFSAYNLPSVEALVRYLHVAAGFPIKSTCLRAVTAGDLATWPGLTYSNAAKYFLQSIETLKVHMVQSRQVVWSTKDKIDTQQPTTREMEDLTTPEKQMKSMYGMNLSESCTHITVAAYQFVHAVENNISWYLITVTQTQYSTEPFPTEKINIGLRLTTRLWHTLPNGATQSI